MKIEKNMPIPVTNGRWSEIVSAWQVGDSVVVEKNQDRKSLRATAFYHGQLVTSRKTFGASEIRVWRTK